MNGIEIRFTSVIARPPMQNTSRNGVKWTRIMVDIPIQENGRDVPSNTWARVSISGDDGDHYMDLRPGDRVYVEGYLRLSSYEKQGKPQVGISVMAVRLNRLDQDGEMLDGPPQAIGNASRTRARDMARQVKPGDLATVEAPSRRQRRRENEDRYRGRRFDDFDSAEG